MTDMVRRICPRCHGKPQARFEASRNLGRCFNCDGAGFIMAKRPITKAEKAIKAQAEADAAAKFNARFAEFCANLAKGN